MWHCQSVSVNRASREPLQAYALKGSSYPARQNRWFTVVLCSRNKQSHPGPAAAPSMWLVHWHGIIHFHSIPPPLASLIISMLLVNSYCFASELTLSALIITMACQDFTHLALTSERCTSATSKIRPKTSSQFPCEKKQLTQKLCLTKLFNLYWLVSVNV